MKTLIFLFLLFLPLHLTAQSKQTQLWYSPDLYTGPYIWLTAGLGKTPNLFKNNAGLAGALVPTIQFGRNIFSVRLLTSAENPLPIASSHYGYDEWVDDLCVLYGRCYKSARFFASASAGLGRTRGMRRGEFLGCIGTDACHYQALKFNTIGVALESQLFIQAPILGFGLYLFGNVNQEDSFGGFLASFQLGHTKKFLRPIEEKP